MKATFQLLGTSFFASLLLSRTRKPWEYGLGFHRCWGCKDGKSYRNAGSLGWKRVALCHLRCRTLDSSSQAGLYRADRMPGGFLKEPGLCFWNIASSDTLHMRMCRTLCFSGLQIGTRFNLAVHFLSNKTLSPRSLIFCMKVSCIWKRTVCKITL